MLETNKKAGLIILMLAITIFPLSILVQRLTQEENIWTQDVKVVSNPFKLWWLEGHDKGVVDYKYEFAGNALGNEIESGSTLIIEHYCTDFTNPYNNTIFLVLKNADDSVKNQFLQIMNPAEGVTIKFLKGSATENELKGWKNDLLLMSSTLESKGVKIIQYGFTTNCTVYVGIENLTNEKVEIFKNTVKQYVPLGVICLYEARETILVDTSSEPFYEMVNPSRTM